MIRGFFSLALLLTVWPFVGGAQTSPLASNNPAPKSPPLLLGAKFTPVPDVLYSHLSTLTRGQGLLVDAVTPDSVADKIGLRRHDILLRYGSSTVQDVKHLAGLIWATPPGSTNKLHVLRAGKPLALNYTLEQLDLPGLPKALIKPSGPPAVNLEAETLPNDKLKVTFTYYAGGSSKLQTITCEGSVEEIESQVHKISKQQQVTPQIRELLDVALQRVRFLKQR